MTTYKRSKDNIFNSNFSTCDLLEEIHVEERIRKKEKKEERKEGRKKERKEGRKKRRKEGMKSGRE